MPGKRPVDDDGWHVRGDGLWGAAGGDIYDLGQPPGFFPIVGRPDRDLLLARLRYALEMLERQEKPIASA